MPSPRVERAAQHEPGLDGVRGLAVLAVLAFHDGRLRGGFLGVSTFFTLSGFLITGLLLREASATGRVSLARFYARRLRRLMPAAIAGLGVAAIVAVVIADAQMASHFGGDGLAALFDVANWRFVVEHRSYADLFAAPSAVQHFWSLAVEEQFYLVLAPAIAALVVWARGRGAVIASVLGGLAVASFTDGWILAGHGIDRAYYGTDARAVEFLVGALLAVAVSRRGLRGRVSRAAAFAGPVALVGLAWATTQLSTSDVALFHGELLACALGGVVLIAAAIVTGPVRTVCSVRPLRALGRISYGVYVYHWPLFLWLTAARTGIAGWPLTALRVAVTLVVATASYHLLEQPIRRGERLLGNRRFVALPAAVAAAACASVAVSAAAPAPAISFAPAASPASVLAASSQLRRADDPTPTSSAAIVAPTSATARVSTAARARPVRRVLVVGDSVALTLGRGIERWGAQHGVLVLNRGALGCALFDDAAVRGYWGVEHRPADWCGTRKLWSTAIAAFHPDVVVVLFGAWDVYDASFDGGRTWNAPGTAPWDAHEAAAVADATRRLELGGARVLWLAPPCFAAGPNDPDPHAPWYDPTRVGVLARIEHSVAPRLGASVSDVVHDRGCPVDLATRPDGVHYSDPGADRVAAALGPDIVRAGRR